METNLGKPQQEGLILGVQVDCGCEVDAGRRELLLEGLGEGLGGLKLKEDRKSKASKSEASIATG